MTGMIEKVARVLCAQCWSSDAYWDESGKNHDYWMAQARAAILAMREPIEAQIVAARAVICEAVDSGKMSKKAAMTDWRLKNRMRWQAMCDAALGDQTGGNP